MPIAFKLPRFYPILDTAALGARDCPVLGAAEGLIEAGVRILQYRHKTDWTQDHFGTARRLATLCHEAGVLFVVNDRADFARLIGAALHVGQNDLPPAAARRIISDEVMGFSTHNRAQLMRAQKEAVEYLSIGPIFATNSKAQPDPEVGLDGLRQLRGLTEKPLVAIGGINPLNATDVLTAGADSVAAIAGLLPEKCSRKTLRKSASEWLQVLTLGAATS